MKIITTFKIAMMMIGLLMSSLVFANNDPIAWSLTQALPSTTAVGSSSTTIYTLTNNTQFLENISFTTNNSEFTITTNECEALASGKTCTVLASYTPTAVGTAKLQLTMHYDITRVPLAVQTVTAAETPEISLTVFPATLNFTSPGTKSITFKTVPATPDLNINVNNLPSGVTGTSSCTTDSTGACSIALTASQSAYGSATLAVVAQGVGHPPAPIVNVAKTMITVADTTSIAAGETSDVTLTNNGAFDWQSTVPNALQVEGNNLTEFAADIRACTTQNIAAGTSCIISFSPSMNANAGDVVHLVSASNSVQKGNGNVYIMGGLMPTLSGGNNPFTDKQQNETLTLTNTSNDNSVLVNNVGFTHGASNINVMSFNDTCTGASLVPGAACTVIYESLISSYGSDTITAHYTIDGNPQTVESALLAVNPPTITLFKEDSAAIPSGSFINLISNTAEQVYVISAVPFEWQNASVTLENLPTNDTSPSSFFTTSNCTGLITPQVPCIVTFNTLVTGAPSIAALNFDPNNMILNVSGSNLGTAPSWPVAPVVGEYMQGGVVFWVGNNIDNTQPGYRKALVAAVADVNGGNVWDSDSTFVDSNAKFTGFFQGTNGQASGQTNTNILINLGNHSAAIAANAYQGGGFKDWFLPAAGTGINPDWVDTLCTLSTIEPIPASPNVGELCEMNILAPIINMTAIAGQHGGSAFSSSGYWGSTDGGFGPGRGIPYGETWLVSFSSSFMVTVPKNATISVRPVRAFTY